MNLPVTKEAGMRRKALRSSTEEQNESAREHRKGATSIVCTQRPYQNIDDSLTPRLLRKVAVNTSAKDT